MPLAVAAKVGIVVATVAVAGAIALYESPELRRKVEDLRRRIAIALHSLGDNVDPSQQGREPIFNRPEDAEGFLQAGVDADEETRRRQREELMYWNALREKQAAEKELAELEEKHGLPRSTTPTMTQNSGTTFDDFMRRDNSGDQGTYVFNTGANVRGDSSGLVRRRGDVEGARGLNATVYANPFADENGVDDWDDDSSRPGRSGQAHPMAPSEVMSDIYSATTREPLSRTLSPAPAAQPENVLFDYHHETQAVAEEAEDGARTLSITPLYALEGHFADNESMVGTHDNEHFASIQAWAQESQRQSFYSPLPVSPEPEPSEPDMISDGAITPTDSVSIVGSGEDIANDAASSTGRPFDVMSESDDGMPTPSSWTEVGSTVSDSEHSGPVHA